MHSFTHSLHCRPTWSDLVTRLVFFPALFTSLERLKVYTGRVYDQVLPCGQSGHIIVLWSAQVTHLIFWDRKRITETP